MKIIVGIFSLFILTALGMKTEFDEEFESDPNGYNIQESDPDEPLDDDTELQQEAPKEEMETQEEQEDIDDQQTQSLKSYGTCRGLYSSCADIKSNNPRSRSGVYRIKTNNRYIHVYCYMGTLCGMRQGWRRLGKLDMTQRSAKCPSSLRMVTQSGTRICTKNKAGCNSVTIPSQGVPYSIVCGRVRGYQKYTLDAFHHHQSSSINSPYVDGVSITHGSPRKHIWTLAAGFSEFLRNRPYVCPCNYGTTVKPAPFVGNDFYCESGFGHVKNHFSLSDPLWDRKQCRHQEAPCCNRPLLPWFRKSLRYATTDNIEMRVCSDQDTNDENIGIDQYEFYVM
uniref:Uncharacterized protein n=1 Tax=Amphimedon queenslandica TaxID=400682 RepID=A0A1X7UPL2_AMPQE